MSERDDRGRPTIRAVAERAGDLRVEAVLVVGSLPDRATLASVLGDVPVVAAAAAAEGLHADVVRNDDRLGIASTPQRLIR